MKRFYFDIAAGQMFSTHLAAGAEQQINRSGRKNRVLTVFNDQIYSMSPDTAHPKGYAMYADNQVRLEEFYLRVKARFVREEKEGKYTKEYWRKTNGKLEEAYRMWTGGAG
jgi:hypothetical protein